MKEKPKSARPNAYGFHQVATRLTPERYAKLKRLAETRAARSLNETVGQLIDEAAEG
jgi:hypothetical protein